MLSMSGGLRRYQGRTVIVHQMPPAPSIEGVLVAVHSDCFVVARARSLDEDVEMAGEQIVPRAPGVFLQVGG